MKTTPGVPLTLGQIPVHIIAPADPAQQSTDPTRGMSGRFPPLGDLRRSLVRHGQEHRSVGLAIDQCQQTCPLTVALEHFQAGNDLQRVLLAANRKNDLSLLATKMILITFAVCASVASSSSSGGHTFELADASATGSD